MLHSITAPQVASMLEAGHQLPARRWHTKGYAISIASSLIMALTIGLFFIAMHGWSPPQSWQGQADFAVTWILLT